MKKKFQKSESKSNWNHDPTKKWRKKVKKMEKNESKLKKNEKKSIFQKPKKFSILSGNFFHAKAWKKVYQKRKKKWFWKNP